MNIRRPSTGFTLIEAILSSALFLLIMSAVYSLYTMAQRGTTLVEAKNAMQSAGQTAINRIQQKLLANKRLLDNSKAGPLYRTKVLASLPIAPLAGTNTRLPVIEPTGSVAPSSPDFKPNSVGNCLLFVSMGPTQTVQGRFVDTYEFNYYYLAPAPANRQQVGGAPATDLWEWHSTLIADQPQLQDVLNAQGTAALKMVAVAPLLANNKNIIFAWDPAAPAPNAVNLNNTFYAINADGSLSVLNGGALTAFVIPTNTKTTRVAVDAKFRMSLGGYRTSISPNTGTLAVIHAVPKFAPPPTGGSHFPSGFEVSIAGPTGYLQVMLRLVQLSEGTFPTPTSNEQLVVVTVQNDF